jgi:hypothetical protein
VQVTRASPSRRDRLLLSTGEYLKSRSPPGSAITIGITKLKYAPSRATTADQNKGKRRNAPKIARMRPRYLTTTRMLTAL